VGFTVDLVDDDVAVEGDEVGKIVLQIDGTFIFSLLYSKKFVLIFIFVSYGNSCPFMNYWLGWFSSDELLQQTSCSQKHCRWSFS